MNNNDWDEDRAMDFNYQKFLKQESEYKKCQVDIQAKGGKLFENLAELALVDMTLCENVAGHLSSYDELVSCLQDLSKNPIIPNEIYNRKHYESCWENAIKDYKDKIKKI